MTKPLITIITPMYNEELNVRPFFDALTAILDKDKKYGYEIIFVDDGSTDASISAAESLTSNKYSLNVLRLSRNFGKEIATTAGIHEAKGGAAIILDSDLQHPVGIIPEFIEEWEKGTDVVIGVRKDSGHNNILKDLSSKLYYKIMNAISSTHVIPHSTDFRLIDRQVIDAFKSFTERERITRGLIDWLGFNRGVVYFSPNEREFGTPSYSFRKLLKLATSSFTAHSLLPLKFAGYLGMAFTIGFGLIGVLVYVEMYLLGDRMGWAISGTAMLAILLLFTIGIILACLGLIALYIATIHGEVTNRPLYVVKRKRP